MAYFGICIESSHAKGMGHLFRAINMFEFLRKHKEKAIIFVNDDDNAIRVLKQKNIPFDIAGTDDHSSGWEDRLIKKHKIDVWINDRLDTELTHAKNIKNSGIFLICLDDRGSGAPLADINFGSLPFNFGYELQGKLVFKGLEYLIINEEVIKFRRLRQGCKRTILSMGGSDTYGVSVKIAKLLNKWRYPLSIICGPSFLHHKELREVLGRQHTVLTKVPSLIEAFFDYDLAITGGGITAFEANASGLPSIIVANELIEVDSAQLLEKLGSSVFAGYHQDIAEEIFEKALDIKKMSKAGIDNLGVEGAKNLFKKVKPLIS